MKILFLNGSPRKGNTLTALNKLQEAISGHKDLQIKRIDATSLSVAPCTACGYCKSHSKCVVNDDTNTVINEIVTADILIFATPVYWWGISAQLKLIIDKFYSQQPHLSASNKKVGLISIGQLEPDNVQYELIATQIKCICNYLGWEILFTKSFSAYEAADLSADNNALSEIGRLAELI